MLHLLLSPLSGLLLAALCALVLGRRGVGWPRLALAAVAFANLLLMTPLGANWLVEQLEEQVARPESECLASPPATIVVLGGGFDRAPADADDLQALTAPSVRRVFAAVRLWRERPQALLVMAGGGPFAVPEGRAMAGLAGQLGVPPARLQLETRSMSTFENLAQLATLQPPVERRIWLVSSAMHLPRALEVARRAGFSACAYAADLRYVPPGGLGYYLPQSSALAKAEDALHELVGGLAYRWR